MFRLSMLISLVILLGCGGENTSPPVQCEANGAVFTGCNGADSDSTLELLVGGSAITCTAHTPSDVASCKSGDVCLVTTTNGVPTTPQPWMGRCL